MDRTEERVSALCAAPVGCLFLLTAEASGLTAAEAARPDVALQVAALTDHDATPWTGSHEEVVAAARQHGPHLTSLARAIVSCPEAGWWWAPLDRRAQWWTGASGNSPCVPEDLVPKTGRRPTDQERYGLMPDKGFLTSTAFGDVTSHLSYLAWGSGDFAINDPIPCRRYAVSDSARVCEIHGPEDWHALVAAHPAAERAPARNEVPGDRPDQVVPDWASVARLWDGVHLSFGGPLTTRFVWTAGPPGPTRNWSWEIEGTWWLRWCFEEVEEDDPPIATLPPRDERIRGAVTWTPRPTIPAPRPCAMPEEERGSGPRTER